MFIGHSQESAFMEKVLKEAKKIELKKMETIIKPPYYALKFSTDEDLTNKDTKKKIRHELIGYIYKSDKIKSSLVDALKKEGKSEDDATKIVNDKWTKDVIKNTVKMQTQKTKDDKWNVIIGYTPAPAPKKAASKLRKH